MSRLVLAAAVALLVVAPGPAEAQVPDQEWRELNHDIKSDIARGKRNVAIQRMGRCTDVRAKKLLIKYLKEWELAHDLRREFALSIGRTKHPASLDYFVKLMHDKKEPTWVKFEVATGIAKMSSDAMFALLSQWVGDEKINVRLAALHGLGSRHTNEDVKGAIAKGLKDQDWQVRYGAMESLLKIKDPQAAPLLMTLMAEARGREEFDCLRALKSLTGGKHRTLDDWVKWWDKGGAYLTKLPGDRFKMFLDHPDDVMAPDDKPPYTGPSFFGVKVVSRRVYFLIDLSTKLEAPFLGKAPPASEGNKEIKTLKDLVINELCRCINSFAPDVNFYIRYCDSQAQPWKRKWTDATAENKAEAIEALQGKSMTGRTDLIKALSMIYRTTRSGTFDNPKNYKDGPDTVFLVSTGYPNTGKIPYRKVAIKGPKWSNKILNTVWNWNIVRKVRFYAIGMGPSPATDLLQGLADGNGGKYIHVPGK